MPFFVKTKKNKVLATKKQMILVGLGRRIYRIKKSYQNQYGNEICDFDGK